MFEKLKYQNCRVFISNVDSQPSRDGGVLVQVLGEMSNNGQPSQKFAQTFFLAKQPKGYYILNDILRFLDEEVESEVETTEETTVVLEKTNLMEEHAQHHQQQQQQQRGLSMQTMETRREQVGHEKSKPVMRAKSPEQPLSVAQATVTTVVKEPSSPLRATSPEKTQKSKSRSPKRTEPSAPVATENNPVEERSDSTATASTPSLSAPLAPVVLEKPKEAAVVPSKPASWAAMVQTAPSPSAAVAPPASSNATNVSGTPSGAKSSTASRTTSPPTLSTSGSTQPSTTSSSSSSLSSSATSGHGQHFHHHHHHHHHSQQQQQQQRGGSHPRSQTGGSGSGNNSGGVGNHSRMEGVSYRSGNGGYRRENDLDPNCSVYIRCHMEKGYSDKDLSDAFKDTAFKRIEIARQGAVCYLSSSAEAKALIGKVSVKDGNQYVVKSHSDPNTPCMFSVEARKGGYLSSIRGSGGGGNKNNSSSISNSNNTSYQRSSRPPLSSSSHPLERPPHPRGNNNASSAGHPGRTNHRNNPSSVHHYDGGMASGMAMSGGRANN